MVNQKVALICIDGWGIPSETSAPEGNAILNAETPWPSVFPKASWATPRSVT
jgi:2,3-bisphosphoglycerate-independent phosphoglycerate mutase